MKISHANGLYVMSMDVVPAARKVFSLLKILHALLQKNLCALLQKVHMGQLVMGWTSTLKFVAHSGGWRGEGGNLICINRVW